MTILKAPSVVGHCIVDKDNLAVVVQTTWNWTDSLYLDPPDLTIFLFLESDFWNYEEFRFNWKLVEKWPFWHTNLKCLKTEVFFANNVSSKSRLRLHIILHIISNSEVQEKKIFLKSAGSKYITSNLFQVIWKTIRKLQNYCLFF